MDTDHHDSDDTQKLRDSYGRGMNTLSEEYKLPADRTEMERLSLQHRTWKLLVGGLYPPTLQATVDKALSGPQPTILDTGCGSAHWSIEMAELYPNVHVVGADLARNFQERTPKNFEFVQMNLAEGLPACRDLAGYDLIHARSFHSHLKDPLVFIRQVEAALKPGGLFIVADFGVGAFGRDKVQLRPRFPTDAAPETGTSWFMGWQDLWVNTMGPILRADELLQRSPLSRIFFEKYFCPVGWVGDDIANGEELGDIMLKNTLQFNRATLPAILATGKFSLEELEIWLDAVEDEVKTKNLYMTLDLGVSVKKTL